MPGYRYRCGFDATAVFRHDWRINLDPNQLPVVQFINGRRTIREIVAELSRLGGAALLSQADLENLACTLMQSLWERDFISLALRL